METKKKESKVVGGEPKGTLLEGNKGKKKKGKVPAEVRIFLRRGFGDPRHPELC